jgi:hypothetical protein
VPGALQTLAQQVLQAICLQPTFIDHFRRDAVARVVVGIPLSAQGVQQDPCGVVDVQGERQRLDQRDMVTRLAGRRAKAADHHGGQSALHHGFVRSIESRFVADAGLPGVSKIPFNGGQQALHLHRRRGVGLQPPDPPQVLQGHVRCP